MSGHYDRQGNPIEMMDWATRMETDRRVAETTTEHGHWISTVWLGLDHRFGSGPPLIFETMVFDRSKGMGDLDCDRYSTEAEALAGHARMVERWKNGEPASVDAVDPQGGSTHD